jgi:hypothetical protein
MKSQDEKIIIEGVEYSPEELEEIYAELMKPTPTPSDPPKDRKFGEGIQFITDQNLYKEIIKYFTKTFSSHANVLNQKFKWNDNKSVVTGSSPYLAVAVDMFFRSQKSKHRIATQRDLETNLQMFKNYYGDTGLALRSVANPNKNQAENLYTQIKKVNPSIEYPIFIELRNLDLDASLNFTLTPQSTYKKADCLNWESGTHFSQKDDYGLPKSEDKDSSRQIWTIKGGLVGAYLDGVLNFGSSDDDLPFSNDGGRVVLVSAEGDAP